MRTAVYPWIRNPHAVTSRPESTLEDREGILGARLTFSTSGLGGAPIVVRQYRLTGDGEVELPSIPDHAIMLLMGRPAYLECRAHDHRSTSLPGACGILPGGATGAWRWIGAPTVLHLYLSAAWVDGILCEEGLDPQYVKVVERSGCYDAFLWTFGAGLLRRMQSGPPIERLMLDGTALGVACHLLRAHSTLACLAGAWTLSAERLLTTQWPRALVRGELP
jgi:hypothetical protein